MSVSSPLSPTTTPAERWLRWQERGQRRDLRLMRRAKAVLVLLLAFAVLAFALIR